MSDNNDSSLLVTLTIGALKELIVDSVKETVAEHLAPPSPMKNYPLQQAADMVGMHRHTLREEFLRGNAKGFKIGNRLYFTDEALREYIDRGGSKRPTKQRATAKASKTST